MVVEEISMELNGPFYFSVEASIGERRPIPLAAVAATTVLLPLCLEKDNHHAHG